MSHPRTRNSSVLPQIQRKREENGGPPSRYRPTRCENPNSGFVETASLGMDKVTSPDHKYDIRVPCILRFIFSVVLVLRYYLEVPRRDFAMDAGFRVVQDKI